MRVCIVTVGETPVIQDDPSDQYVIHSLVSETTNVPKHFNVVKEEVSKDFDIIGFVDRGYTIAEEDALAQIIQIFKDFPEVNGVFADVSKIYPEGASISLHHPSAFLGMCDRHYINSPFFIRTLVEHKFDPNMVHAYMFDFIKRVNLKYCTWHIPEPLFSRDMSIAPNEEQELREALRGHGG